MNNWALKFIRWGMGLTVLGLITGYFPLGHYDFYYAGTAAAAARTLWFAIDGTFLTIYAAGCIVFLYIVVKKTEYTGAAATV
jgi:hypothetical protein